MRALVADGRDGAALPRVVRPARRTATVAGKDPLAVFLTQLSRSPAVRKGAQPGVYELDRQAPARLRATLDDLHEQLRDAHHRHRPRRHPRPPRTAHGRDRPHREGARGNRARARARARPRGRRLKLSARSAIIRSAMAPTVVIRPAEPRDAEAVAAIYNHGIERAPGHVRDASAAARTRSRAGSTRAGRSSSRPTTPAASSASPASPPYSDPHARTRAWGSTASTSTRRRAAAGVGLQLMHALADGGGSGRLLQAHQPRLHHQPRQPGAAPRRRLHRGRRPAPPRPARRRVEGHGPGRTTVGRRRALRSRIGSAQWLVTARRASPPGPARAVRASRAGCCSRSRCRPRSRSLDIAAERRG